MRRSAAWRSASPRCANATTTRFPARTNAASSFSASREPARGDRRPLGLERERLARGNGSSSAAPSRSSGVEPLLLPDAPHVVRLPDEVGRAVDGRHEVARPRRRHLVVARERRLDEIRAPLGGGVDARVLDGVERPLRERREGAHLLDLVAEELDAERLAARGREDVDDPAANGELAALVDALDPLVAGERELPRRARRRRAPSPTRSSSGAGRASSGGSPSASAVADAQTSPPAASTSSAR